MNLLDFIQWSRLNESLGTNQNYFSLIDQENPFSGFTRLGKTLWSLKVMDTEFIIKDDGHSVAKLMHDGKKVAECLYLKTDDGIINIDLIVAEVQGRGYAKLLMLHLINRFGIENIDRKLLTRGGQKMFDELDRFLSFDYGEHYASRITHLDKVKLVNQLALTRPVLSVFLETVCDYGKEAALEVFSNDIINHKIEGYPINKIFQLSEWIDDSVEYSNQGSPMPEEITLILDELGLLK
jgi:hypothetical protein